MCWIILISVQLRLGCIGAETWNSCNLCNNYAHCYWNKRFHVPEINACRLTSSEFTNASTVFFSIWSMLSGCDHSVGQPAVIGAFPVLVPEYISCPSLGCRTEHTIFSCTSGRKLGHWSRQGAVRLPWPEQVEGQIWEYATEYDTCHIEGAVVVTDETGMLGVAVAFCRLCTICLGSSCQWLGGILCS